MHGIACPDIAPSVLVKGPTAEATAASAIFIFLTVPPTRYLMTRRFVGAVTVVAVAGF